jgi:hypothetical protein
LIVELLSIGVLWAYGRMRAAALRISSIPTGGNDTLMPVR